MLKVRSMLPFLAALVTAAVVSAACGGKSGSPTPAASEPAPTSVFRLDSDHDGVPDEKDACPTQKEDLRWTTEADGCPDGLPDLMTLGRDDINDFWQRTFDEANAGYRPPVDVISYDHPIKTGCGTSIMENAFYCGRDRTIYYDSIFLQAELTKIGDFGPVFILAHEWGHMVQDIVGILVDPNLLTIDTELQADCFAGAYTADADRRELLEEGDINEAIIALFHVGDPIGTPYFDPSAHGSAGQRIDAFDRGKELGVDACFEPFKY